MDDFVILHDDKKALQTILGDVTAFLDDQLRLKLNRKTQIFPIGPRSLDFLGYRIWPNHRLLRKNNVKRTKRKLHKYERLYTQGNIGMEKVNPSVMSWLGHAMHADTYHLRNRFLAGLVFKRAN
jgi:RNA-directed DNA polymerase